MNGLPLSKSLASTMVSNAQAPHTRKELVSTSLHWVTRLSAKRPLPKRAASLLASLGLPGLSLC